MRSHDGIDAETDFHRLPKLGRRHLLIGAGGSAAALAFMIGRPSRASAAPEGTTTFTSDPFTLGIASGDPLSNAVVIWTRLAPKLFEPYGGLVGSGPLAVKWQVATDENFAHVVRSGTATARPEYTFTVHVDVLGLRPGTEYFYRFSAGGYLSDTGRTKTSPHPTHRNSSLKFAFASCQSYGAGYFTAAGHMAQEDVDLIFFLGDYIYDYALTAEASNRVDPTPLPSSFDVAANSLSRYRLQYAAYKSDPHLREAHRVAPWILTWDDGEVHDNYNSVDANADELVKRANAYRAYWEHQPLRPPQAPVGPDARLYRRFDFGRLARFSMLDARQFRSPEVSNSSTRDTPQRRDPARTILGVEQEKWFLDGLKKSRTLWNIVPQGLLMSMLDTDPTDDRRFSAFEWDGYQASQQRVLSTVADHQVSNFVVLSGDIHRNYVLDMKANFDDPTSATIGSEFAGTSLVSGGDGIDWNSGLDDRFAANPHLRWASLQRGYVRCTLDRQSLAVDYREVPYVTREGAPVYTKKSFVVEEGVPGVQDA